jgi:uncharacterized membrane protein (DUF485 family)
MNWSDEFGEFPSQFAWDVPLRSAQMTSAWAFAVLELLADHVIAAIVHVIDASGHVMNAFDHVIDMATS